jgi:hypothetical protein
MDKKELKKFIQKAIKGYNSKSFGRILKFSYPHLLTELESITKEHNPKNITESIYILLNGSPKLCGKGKKPVFAGYDQGYRQYCGSHSACECNKKDQSKKVKDWADSCTPEQKEDMRKKQEMTLLERYGVTNAMQSPEVLARIEAENIKKYGVPYHLQREEVKAKTKQTLINKYGVDTPFASQEILKKAHNTTKDKYGGLMTHARKGAYDKYDGKNPFHVPEVQAKRSEAMVAKYGTEHALQNPEIYESMLRSNLTKYGRANPAQMHYSPDLWDILKDPNKFLETVKGRSSVQVAQDWHVSSDLILRYARKHGVLEHMNFSPRSAMEEDLTEWLTKQDIPFKRNDKLVLRGKEIDVLLPAHNLGIELNGLYQHSELAGEKDPKYHWHKTKGCEIKGIQLLHVWQDEYWSHKHIIQSKILYLMGRITQKIPARSCVLAPIHDAKLESEFLNANHIQGYADYRQHSMAAWCNDQIVGIMSFAQRKGRLELVRYATDVNCICVGLFSRLFHHAVKQFKFSGKIISQSDNRISNGALYLQTGWQYEGEQSPNYSYTGDYQTRQNKEHFMKGKLTKKFSLDPDYVATNTEWQIMQDLGYDRLWDAGKKIWSKTV